MKKTFYKILAIAALLQLRGYNSFAQSSDVSIFNESEVNTAFQEYSPVFFRNGLVFTTSTPSVNKEKIEDNFTGKPTTSIFFSGFGYGEKLQKPVPFANELVSKYYDGPVSFSPMGDMIYFTRTNQKYGEPVMDKDGAVRLKIYSAKLNGMKWEDIKEMPFNSKSYDCTHPSVSYDGKKLFFASNRPEGFGGMDLYVSTFINGEWSEPINLGPSVNTPKNEVFPYISQEGKLYFSSDGRKGFGNLDIFYTEKTDKAWSVPTLLPEPINSRSDDFGITMNFDNSMGFFSSNRAQGKGDDDIYRFIAPRGVNAPPLPENELVEEEMELPADNLSTPAVEVTKPREFSKVGNSSNENNLVNTLNAVMSLVVDSVNFKKDLKPDLTLPFEPAKAETIVTAKGISENSNSVTKPKEETKKVMVKPAVVKSSDDIKKDNKRYLVVVGTYSQVENAYDQYYKIAKMGVNETAIVHYADSKMYGVFIKSTANEKEAFSTAENFKKEKHVDAFVKMIR